MIISEEQRLAVAELRRHLDSKVEPIVVEYRDRFIPKEQMVAIVRDLVPFGLIAAPFAEEQGGMGLEWETHLRLYEEVVYTSADVAGPILINAVGADLLLRHGSAAQVRRYIPGVLAGELMLCVCISEPDVGSDVSAVSTRARRDGDHFVINGEKTWITNGGYADLAVVTARTSDEPRAGLTHFLVDRTEHGFESREIHKIALNSQSTAQLFFTDVRVPAENMLGNEGDGLRNTLQVFEVARLHVAMWALGIGRRAMDEAIRYAQNRVQHGKPIAGHQLIAAKLAEMATEIDAARLLIMRGAQLIQAGRRADKECAMAKWYATEIALKAARDALQIHGGNGVTREFLVEKLVREALVIPIPDGTTEIQKLLIARSLTGVSAFS